MILQSHKHSNTYLFLPLQTVYNIVNMYIGMVILSIHYGVALARRISTELWFRLSAHFTATAPTLILAEGSALLRQGGWLSIIELILLVWLGVYTAKILMASFVFVTRGAKMPTYGTS